MASMLAPQTQKRNPLAELPHLLQLSSPSGLIAEGAALGRIPCIAGSKVLLVASAADVVALATPGDGVLQDHLANIARVITSVLLTGIEPRRVDVDHLVGVIHKQGLVRRANQAEPGPI